MITGVARWPSGVFAGVEPPAFDAPGFEPLGILEAPGVLGVLEPEPEPALGADAPPVGDVPPDAGAALAGAAHKANASRARARLRIVRAEGVIRRCPVGGPQMS